MTELIHFHYYYHIPNFFKNHVILVDIIYKTPLSYNDFKNIDFKLDMKHITVLKNDKILSFKTKKEIIKFQVIINYDDIFLLSDVSYINVYKLKDGILKL